MLADTHCHLYWETFAEDLSAVLERAWEHGVSRILIPGIDLATCREAVALSEKHQNLYAAVGVHPNDALSWDDDTIRELSDLAQHPKVVAIGEIGLDYYRDRAPRELQRKVFERQLELAAESRLPVVIHNRQAIDHVLEQLLAWQNQLTQQGSPLAILPGVLHSYEGSLTNANQAIAGRFSIGISGPVTFRNAPDRQQLVKELPLDRILLETDAPFLAPHPHRGRRNEPAYVRLIAQKVAELHAVDLEAVAQESTRRASQLFNWGAPV